MDEQQLRQLIAEYESSDSALKRSLVPTFKSQLRQLLLGTPTEGEGVTRDPATGLYTTADGKTYETLSQAEAAARAISTEEERAKELEETRGEAQEQLGELEQLIQRSARAQRQMAERVGARQTGQLMSQLERSILGAGGEAQALEALAPGIQERAERSLLDRLTGIEAQTAQQLQQVPRLGLQQATTMAQLQQQQQRISDAMERARMSQELGIAQLETERARTQARLDQQPEWWEGILGAAGTAIGTAVGGPVGGAIGGALTGAFTRQPQSTTTIGSSPVIYDSF